MRKGNLPPLSTRRLTFQLPPSENLEVKWVAEGEGWVVLSKPSGLLSVPGTSRGFSDDQKRYGDCAEMRVRRRYPNASGGLVVHRLDLPTSGLMVFALNPQTLTHLNQQFASRTTSKRYTAVLSRVPQDQQGEIHLPLRLDPFQRPLQIVDPVHGRPSHTRWKLMGTHALGALVELEPVTGRTHQLRLHMAHPLGLNAPIVGDPHYSREATADGSSPQGVRLHLHASSLSFDDPLTGTRLSFEDSAPFI